jgi:nicotinamidase-related amidase
MGQLSILMYLMHLLFNCSANSNYPVKNEMNSIGYERPDSIEITLNYRDASGSAYQQKVVVNPTSLAIVVVDMWNSHGCLTMVQKEVELIPLMNQTLEAARELGMQVVFAPSGCNIAEEWAGKPQRTSVEALDQHPLPASNGFNPEKMPDWGSQCMCPITEIQSDSKMPVYNCKRGHSATDQHPDLVVKEQDMFINANDVSNGINTWGAPAQQELYNLCMDRGIEYIFYVGCATNMCVVNREFGMVQMRRLNLKPVLIRDLTHAMTYNGYNPDTKSLDPNFTPAHGTELSIQSIECYIGPTINSGQILNPVIIE